MTDRAEPAAMAAPMTTLVCQGDYYGSLAATRCLGRAGISVDFAEHRRLAPAQWSRHVRRRVKAPPVADLAAFGDFLVRHGRQSPGAFLYPTSDDFCWILAARESELREGFKLHPSPAASARDLLDKRRLHILASAAGLKTPATVFPTGDGRLTDLGDLRLPVLLKPRTQMGSRTKGKGRIVTEANQLDSAITAWRQVEQYDPAVLAWDPTIAWPMVQEYQPSAMNGILSIAGYVGPDPESCVMVASEKVFQRPRRLGVGIGFEARPVPAGLATQLVALCRHANYTGIFEAEFIRSDAEDLLCIDFNPRYYGQLGFEVARGLPTPLLACLAAHGRHDEVRSLAQRAAAAATAALSRPVGDRYALSWILRLMLLTQRLGGVMPADEATRWRGWLRPGGALHCHDALFGWHDPVPAALDIATTAATFLRHPRDFYRKFFS